MSKSNKFSPELRERTVRMVPKHRGESPSLWAAIESIAPKIGCVPQTLRGPLRVLAALPAGSRAYTGWRASAVRRVHPCELLQKR